MLTTKGNPLNLIRKGKMVESFGEMVGMGKLELTIALRKTRIIRDQCKRFINVVKLLSKSTIVDNLGANGDLHIKINLNKFVDSLTADYEAMYVFDMASNLDSQIDTSTHLDKPENLVDKTLLAAFFETYALLQDTRVMSEILHVCNYLVSYRGYLDFNQIEPDADGNKHIKDTFLTKRAGLQFNPFMSCDFNFKYAYFDDVATGDDKKYLLHILSKLLEISYAVYETLMKPDIDIEAVTGMINASIYNLRKQIQRCDDAFDRLENGISLLHRKFAVYYCEYKVSKNADVFMFNYISDIARESDVTPRIAAQFKRIVGFVNDKAAKARMFGKMAGIDLNAPKVENPVGVVLEEISKKFTDMEVNFDSHEMEEYQTALAELRDDDKSDLDLPAADLREEPPSDMPSDKSDKSSDESGGLPGASVMTPDTFAEQPSATSGTSPETLTEIY